MFGRWFTIIGAVIVLAACGAAVVPNTAGTTPAVETPRAEAAPTDVPFPTTAADGSGYPAEAATPTIGADSSGYPGTTTKPDAATSATADSDVLAVWSRVGGFAGLQEFMTVYTDGRMDIDRNGIVTSGQVPTLTLEELRATFASDAWRALDAKYGQQYPDAFAYTITAGGKSVQTYDGAEPPEPLATILEQFAALYTSGEAPRVGSE